MGKRSYSATDLRQQQSPGAQVPLDATLTLRVSPLSGQEHLPKASGGSFITFHRLIQELPLMPYMHTYICIHIQFVKA